MVFGGVYIALYTRFASQWSYLANVYNQIKQAEVTIVGGRDQEMAEWKAGFIEDAIGLHLSKKTIFSGTIAAWASQPEVKNAFLTFTADGQSRWNQQVQPIINDLSQ